MKMKFKGKCNVTVYSVYPDSAVNTVISDWENYTAFNLMRQNTDKLMSGLPLLHGDKSLWIPLKSSNAKSC
jgi:hypothetical protein